MFPSVRTERIIALSGNDLTQTEVAHLVGVSRQRVEQLVRKHGLSFRDGRYGKQTILCSRCSERTQSKASPPVCGACRGKAAWIEVPCLTCGKPVRTRRGEVNARLSKPRYHRLFRQEHRVCQSNRTAPCMVCGNSVSLTAYKAWRIRRRGAHALCPDEACRDKWMLEHMAKMRAKRWSSSGDGQGTA